MLFRSVFHTPLCCLILMSMGLLHPGQSYAQEEETSPPVQASGSPDGEQPPEVSAPKAETQASGSATSTLDFQSPECDTKMRYVQKGTPVLQGPGIGYSTLQTTEENACLPILKFTSDGRFLLVQLNEKIVGWVNTGLVDTRLNQLDKNPGLLPRDGKRYATKQAVLREEPRLDAPVVGQPLKSETVLDVIGMSSNQQWFFVQAGEQEGWVIKYQTLPTQTQRGAPPTAGKEGWASTRAGRVTIEEQERRTQQAAQPTETTLDAKPSDRPDEKSDVGSLEEQPFVPTFILGRTQEIRLGVGYGYWQQSYRSDAQSDPFQKYDLQAPLGLDLGLGYAFRGAFPLVVDLDLQMGFTGFNGAIDATTATTVLAGHVSPSAKLAWRLFSGHEVDVEAGIRIGTDLLWVYAPEADNFYSALTGYHLGIGPAIGARTRLSNGRFGMMSFEVAVPLSGYGMLPDPYTRYTENGDGTIVYESARAQDAVDNADAEPTEMEAPALVHLAVGVDTRVRYVYAFTKLFQLQLYLGAGFRQAWIDGPGYRTADAYSQAVVTDALIKTGIGLTFGL